MTVTADYTATHVGFALTADRFEVLPFTVRVAVALCEGGDRMTTHELTAAVQTDSASVRRSLLEGYALGLFDGRGVDGDRRRRGIVTSVTLTERGRDLVAAFWLHHSAQAQVAA